MKTIVYEVDKVHFDFEQKLTLDTLYLSEEVNVGDIIIFRERLSRKKGYSGREYRRKIIKIACNSKKEGDKKLYLLEWEPVVCIQ